MRSWRGRNICKQSTSHSRVLAGLQTWLVVVEDPDGNRFRLYTLEQHGPDAQVVITAELCGISASSQDAPVRGSGVFIGGHGDWNGAPDGGTVRVSTLLTGEIHTDGGIPPGTPDLISGGVFVISGAIV